MLKTGVSVNSFLKRNERFIQYDNYDNKLIFMLSKETFGRFIQYNEYNNKLIFMLSYKTFGHISYKKTIRKVYACNKYHYYFSLFSMCMCEEISRCLLNDTHMI